MSKVMGRPVIFNDEKLEQLEKYMIMGPKLKNTAWFFRCSETTIEDTIRKHYDLTFREFREQRAEPIRDSLQKKAYQMAMQGNATMLIFALKNRCGWSDKQEVNSTVNTPNININYKVVENGTNEEAIGNEAQSDSSTSDGDNR